jgi:hypothetical protein
VGTFTGTFTPQRFTENGETIAATGLVSGELVDSQGTSLGTASAPATTAVTQLLPGPSCECST